MFLMTQFTLVAGIHMRGTLTAGRDTVMTRDTVSHNSTVIDSCCWNPGINTMAAIAFGGCYNMRSMFTGCDNIIVTTGTNTTDLIMIHRRRGYRNPGSGIAMTGFTDIRRLNMRSTLTRCPDIVMTGIA
jgi:hypothetical protein